MRRRLIVLPAVLSALLLLSSPVAALGTLDQHCDVLSGGSVAVGAPQSLGQVFTSSLTGLLDTVALEAPFIDQDGYTVEITAAASGLPDTATILASQVVATWPAGTLVQVAFTTPAAVTAGTQYAIVVVPLAGTVLQLASCADNYAGGTGVVLFPNLTTWDDLGQDFVFQTYVTPLALPPAATTLPNAAVPEPGPTSGLAALGFAALLIGALGTLAVVSSRRAVSRR